MSYGMNEVDIDINNAYFRYLGDFVGADTLMDGRYWMLLKTLHSIEFYWFNSPWKVALDSNRAESGEMLRKKFFYESHHYNDNYEEFLYKPCSMLEMMIGLAKQLEGLLADIYVWDPDTTQYWFWAMVKNLGLLDCSDDNWSVKKAAKIRHAVTDMLDRNYDKNGHGSMFPVNFDDHNDFRYIQIWDQAMAWITDNDLGNREKKREFIEKLF